MGDKISALPPAAAAATDQLIPVVNDPGGTPETQKLTAAQLLTLMIASVLNQLNSQSNTLFDDNGASIGGSDGSGIAAFCQGNIQMQMPGGAATFAAGKIAFNADGSASFASGAATIGSDGILKAAFFNGNSGSAGINLNDDGDAFFVGSTEGLSLSAPGDLATIKLTTADGSIKIRNQKVNVGGTLKVDTTTTGNVGGGEDDLISFTVPANTLANDGEFLEFDCWGTFAANAHAKEVKVKFGADVLIDTTALVLNGKDWRAHGKIVVTQAGTQFLSTCEFSIGGTLLSSVNGVITTTLIDSFDGASSIVFKCTGQDSDGSPSNDSIVQNGMVLKWYPAQ